MPPALGDYSPVANERESEMDAEKQRDKAIEAYHANKEAVREWLRQIKLEEGWKPGEELELELDAEMEDW